jgi:hypothetical protein
METSSELWTRNLRFPSNVVITKFAASLNISTGAGTHRSATGQIGLTNRLSYGVPNGFLIY